MDLTDPGWIEQAKKAESPQALEAFARDNGVALTRESAAAYYEQLHKTGELSDDELDDVAGGGCGSGGNTIGSGDRVVIRAHHRQADGSDHVGHSGVLEYTHGRYSVRCDCGAPSVGVSGPEAVLKL